MFASIMIGVTAPASRLGFSLKTMDSRIDRFSDLVPRSVARLRLNLKWMRLRSIFALIAAVGVAGPVLFAQSTTLKIDPAQIRVLPNHHPLWAAPANDIGVVPANQTFENLTLVLARSPERENAFQQFLADQQNPSSPDFHHWLTPEEVGERFGLSEADVATITGWLQSQGLHVNWVSPGRTFIGIGGTAGDIGLALRTEMHRYRVNGLERISVSSDPMIPAALSSAVKAVHGLYAIDDEPQHVVTTMQWDSPEITTPGGVHFIGPGDFYNIYDLPNGITGAGITIGIVGRSRTNAADFNNFKSLAGSNFTNPTEIVPTAYGGVDPGPAYTSPPGSGISIGDQSEATLDVLRAGTVAQGAQLLLVVASEGSGGIEADAQYLVNTTPVPVQVMTVSYGACESSAGPAGVSYWDAVFKQAAAEGISSFASSGDSGASGCDAAFTTPPAGLMANSPNYICSSSYVTCVGGTEFNDIGSTNDWGIYSGNAGPTATHYIPEGGWNESWNGTTSIVAASGGGVSAIIATPNWQVGVPGVPAANAGRYTPDVAFSSSMHDAYFACFAAGGGSCVVSGGGFYYSAFAGTSAAAPSMAGIAALLDQNLAGAQGNLNPGLYQMSFGAPSAFHDVTLASSGVVTCDINTPSMCNNSIPGPVGLSGGQAGYAVGTGYDEVTGLGSLDAATFVFGYATASKIMTPTMSAGLAKTVNTYEPIFESAIINGGPYSPAPTGSVTITTGSYSSGPLAINYGVASVNLAAGTLPVGNYTVNEVYTPDAASAPIYTSVTATAQLAVIVPPRVAPTFTLSPSQTVISDTQAMTVGVVVNAAQYYPTPTGSVTLTSGSYTSLPVVLVSARATITVPAGSLAVGSDTLTVTYTPDASSMPNYLVASSFIAVQNEGAKITPSVFTWDPLESTCRHASLSIL